MPDSQTTHLNDIHIAKNLHLVDFSQSKPDTLKQQVLAAIDTANRFLDQLNDNSSQDNSNIDDSQAINAQNALNDITKFDHINLELERSWGVLSHLNSVMSDDDIRHTHHELLPKLSAFSTRVGQHKPLFERYEAIKNDSEFFNTLGNARQRAIELACKRFEMSGVALSKDKQAEYGEIQSKLSGLSAKFSDNILDATQAFALPLSDEQLSGITDTGLAMLAQAGKRYREKNSQTENSQDTQANTNSAALYVATLDVPAYLAVMTHADDRNLREQLYKAYVTRASEFDTHTNAKGEALNNADNMAQILALRAQKAALLGFDNHAEVSLSTKMADSVEAVKTFLRDLAQKATPAAQKDIAELTQAAKAMGIDELKPWDVSYVAEKIKQDKLQLSQEEIRPYFPLPTVINGLFEIVKRLYGIRIIEKTQQTSRWHDDVLFYELYDADERLIGGFYFDLYTRPSKRGGAWMSGFQSRYQYHVPANNTNQKPVYSQLPVCFMVGNFTPPTAGKPSLLTHQEVLTLFHEFGHGLHHLLTEVNVGDVAGVNGVEWDAVELPSQFMENWAWDSEGIALISSHVDTGKPLPQDKLNALLAAKNFQSGMQTLRQVEFALFDLLIHAQNPAPDYQGILNTLNQVRDEVAVIPTPDYNRFANGFSHIFAGGYAAGYYSYKWAELLSADAFSKFEDEGVFNAQTGKAFKDTILAVGGSLPAKTNFEAFMGRPANIDALLRHSGFTA